MAIFPTVELVKDFLQVQLPYSPELIAAVKSIGYARWDPKSKVWVLPNSAPNLEALKKALPSLVLGPALRNENAVEAENLLEAEIRKYIPAQRDVQIHDFAFKTEPLWHQKVVFQFSRALDQCAIFCEQGLGKSKSAIDLATWRFRQGKVHRVLYITPNSVVPQWGTEDVRKHLHDDFNNVTILRGSSKERAKVLEELVLSNKPGWIITNFESLLFIEYVIDRLQGKNQSLYQMMVIDESSKIKHANSQRSKVCWRLGKTVKYRNIMTGTPITQGAEDIFSQYRFLKSDIFGPFATAFRGTYLMLGGFENRQTVGYRNITDLYQKIFSVGIRFTKELCLNLPAKIYEKRTATLGKDVSKKYRTLERECIAEFAGKQISAPMAMTRLMKLSQITSGFVYEQGDDGERVATHEFADNPKLEVLKEIIEEVSANKKIIIWTRFTQEIKIVSEFLEQEKIKYVAIHGAVKSKDRGTAVETFQTDPTVRVFIGQVATASLGITLTAASVVVYFSNEYSLEARLQSEDRCHRIGQSNSVLYIDILAATADGKKTIDHDTLDVIKGKAAFANEVSMALVSRMMNREIDKPVAENKSTGRTKSKISEDEITEEGESF